ncbi:MAG: hypothetical protein A3I11_02790 [Elusimicrobia bacterium RIFCSPLOWO2_02_FULL_39_32]|nr:MAG: hypothetical protein A3B80_01595 [Elusimicrobia bacterium RIFCSPHIGHO2_02_FULL_39_36]OGR93654.1 MAG: hypothetical protein A3I11_02790 [Elusimicrobia bacterium RIFCSPLOWO2_02_FULL_39_32]OGS00475.1 MAG: hypothetical protein A3G85_09220 [Elusimicrobia bacterium RIFCSPLOWO2_12_FULL_39_28]
MNELTIGQIAKKADVNVQTIYFYERKNLVTPVKRRDTAISHSGYRIYSEAEVQKIRFIKNAQELGFSLKEISELLHLRISTKAQCGLVQLKAEKKLKSIEEKLKSLSQLKKVLGNLLNVCRNRKTTDACPILKSLQKRR